MGVLTVWGLIGVVVFCVAVSLLNPFVAHLPIMYEVIVYIAFCVIVFFLVEDLTVYRIISFIVRWGAVFLIAFLISQYGANFLSDGRMLMGYWMIGFIVLWGTVLLIVYQIFAFVFMLLHGSVARWKLRKIGGYDYWLKRYEEAGKRREQRAEDEE